MAHQQNRKYLQSTGVLLKTLADEPKSTQMPSYSTRSNIPPSYSQPMPSHNIFQIHPDDVAMVSGNVGKFNARKPAPSLPQQSRNQAQSKPSSLNSEEIEIVGEVAHSRDDSRGGFSSRPGQTPSTVCVAAKPQSNFVNNVTCLNRLLSKNDAYALKLRRFKPYSTLRASSIVSAVDRGLGSDDETESGDAPSATKVIVIDDSNDEMHKPWITPDLIKLIKQRNLLQAKLGEAKDAETVVNEELMKKFKNLRNKVTKLVKKARKDYLTKYGQEGAAASMARATDSKTLTLKSTDSVTSTATDPNSQAGPSTTSSTTILNISASTITTTTNKSLSTTSVSSSDPTVNELLSKIASGSFLKDQSSLMSSMYSTYYTQYVEQYTKMQQEAATEATASGANYDGLQKQAAQYAKHQRSVQNQLEATLLQSAQQLVQEIANAAAEKTRAIQHHHQLPALQPPPPAQQFVINQMHPFGQLNLHPVHHF